MTLRTFVTAAALTLAGAVSTANAAEIASAQAGSIDLGTLAGVAYFTAEPAGYRVVVTLAPRAAAPSVRFETVLTADQGVTLSTPRAAGDAAQTIEIRRLGDRVLVSQPRQTTVTREAAALN